MPEPWQLARETILAELFGVLGSGVFESFDKPVREATIRAATELARQAAGGKADPQRMAEARAVLQNVKVAGMGEAGTMWDALRQALQNLAAPLAKLLAQFFGVRL